MQRQQLTNLLQFIGANAPSLDNSCINHERQCDRRRVWSPEKNETIFAPQTNGR